MTTIVLQWKPRSTSHIYWIRVLKKWNAMIPMSYLTADGKKLREDYTRQISRQYHSDPMIWDLEVEIEVYRFWIEPDRDNVHKLSMDAWNGLLRIDDKQVTTAIVKKMWKDNDNPRIVLHIKPECRHIRREHIKQGGSMFDPM